LIEESKIKDNSLDDHGFEMHEMLTRDDLKEKIMSPLFLHEFLTLVDN